MCVPLSDAAGAILIRTGFAEEVAHSPERFLILYWVAYAAADAVLREHYPISE